MIKEILIGGFGGQGIMLMGKLLAYGAIHQGLEVSFFPSYGPQMRGGTANCTVVISDRQVGSPIRSQVAVLLAMNQASLDRFEERVKPDSVIVLNETTIGEPPRRNDISIVWIPAGKIAGELGNPQVANLAALGGLIPVLDVIPLDALIKGLTRILPEHRQHLMAINEQAMRMGEDAVVSARAT